MSDNYIVSARKYRPQTFDTVVGQSHITTTLKNAIKHNQLAHAFLFCGPRGVGKTTCARILAKTINCEHPTEDMEACGVCSSCVGFKNNALFNIFELDAASNNSVSDIRELTEQVRYAPQQGKYKIYIIDEVHMLTVQAFNAFLKTLEEPPHYAIFILATTEKHKILPTILSRCQIFDFKRITTNDIVIHLQDVAQKEGMQTEEAAMHIIAQKSEGCMRDALSMLDRISSFTNGVLSYANTMEHLNLLDADFYFKMIDCLLSQDVAGTLLTLDNALERGFEGDTIIAGLAEHFRNLLLCKDSRMAKLLDIPTEHKRLFFEKANQMPPSYIITCLAIINQSEIEYRHASNRRLHVEICLIRLCYALQATSAESAPESSDLKKKSDDVDITKSNINNAVAAPTKQPAPTTTPPKAIAETVRENANAVYENIAPHQPKNTTAKYRRLGTDIIGNLDQEINNMAVFESAGTKELSFEDVKKVFDKFKDLLAQNSGAFVAAQFAIMKLELNPPDEVKIISPTDFIDNYAKSERNTLIDFYKNETGRSMRITTTVIADDSYAANQPVVLSKTEIYETMAAKNPNLAKFKESLNLSLEL